MLRQFAIASILGSAIGLAFPFSVDAIASPTATPQQTAQPPSEDAPKPSLYRGSGRNLVKEQCRRPGEGGDRPRCILTDLPGNNPQPFVPPDRGAPDGTIGSGVR